MASKTKIEWTDFDWKVQDEQELLKPLKARKPKTYSDRTDLQFAYKEDK